MADVYSTGYNNRNASPPVNMPPKDGGGRVRLYYDTYLQGASPGNIGDVIYFKPLPAGARVLPGGKMFWGTGTASATLAVGTPGAATRFAAATAITTAGSGLLEAHLASGASYDAPATGIDVIGTNATAAIAANQRITLWIPYVID